MGNQPNCPSLCHFDICTISWNKKEMERKDTLWFDMLTIYGVLQYLVSCLLFTFPWRIALWSECTILNAIHMQITSLFPLMDCLRCYYGNKSWWGLPCNQLKRKSELSLIGFTLVLYASCHCSYSRRWLNACGGKKVVNRLTKIKALSTAKAPHTRQTTDYKHMDW